MPYSLAFSSLGLFCVKDYNGAKMDNSSGRYGIRSQATQSLSKFQYLFQALKKKKKSLERIPSLAYTEIKYTIHSFFTDVCIFGHCVTY